MKLDSADFIKGLVVAVLAALATYFAQVLNVPGFDVIGIEWAEVGRVAMAALVAYMSKNLLSDEKGKFMGKL